MADDAVTWTPQAADRISAVVRDYEQNGTVLAGQFGATRQQAQETFTVSVTGAISSGLYPATVTAWNEILAAWEDFGAVKVKAGDGETLAIGARYPVRTAGETAGGDLVCVTLTSGSLTVREADFSPTVVAVNTISFDSSHGYIVTGSTGLVNLAFASASQSQMGAVNLAFQWFGGDAKRCLEFQARDLVASEKFMFSFTAGSGSMSHDGHYITAALTDCFTFWGVGSVSPAELVAIKYVSGGVSLSVFSGGATYASESIRLVAQFSPAISYVEVQGHPGLSGTVGLFATATGGVITNLGTGGGSNGQILIGSGGGSGSGFTLATITGSNSIIVTNGSGSITLSVRSQMSITDDSSGIKFVGDLTSPGNTKLYGTNSSGVRGWYDQPSAGTSYTDEMAQDAVGGILIDSTTIDFTYNDGADTITAVAICAQSVDATKFGITLLNDQASPGNNKVYSTDGSGTKGWNPLSGVGGLTWSGQPATSSSSGNAGEIAYGSETLGGITTWYLYVAVSSGVWKRAILNAW